MKKNLFKKTNGFTLIELLVVISIIGLLSTLSVVSLNNARLKSRDAKRLSDVKQMQTALELYYNDCNRYPPENAAALNNIGTTVAQGGAECPGSNVYLSMIPTNPAPRLDGGCPDADYYYEIQTFGGVPAGSYTITYCLGQTTAGIPGGVDHRSTPAGLLND